MCMPTRRRTKTESGSLGRPDIWMSFCCAAQETTTRENWQGIPCSTLRAMLVYAPNTYLRGKQKTSLEYPQSSRIEVTQLQKAILFFTPQMRHFRKRERTIMSQEGCLMISRCCFAQTRPLVHWVADDQRRIDFHQGLRDLRKEQRQLVSL